MFKRNVSFYYAMYLTSSADPDIINPDQGGKRDSGVKYDERFASFCWGTHVPKTEIQYLSREDIPNTHQFVLDKTREWDGQKSCMI